MNNEDKKQLERDIEEQLESRSGVISVGYTENFQIEELQYTDGKLSIRVASGTNFPPTPLEHLRKSVLQKVLLWLSDE